MEFPDELDEPKRIEPFQGTVTSKQRMFVKGLLSIPAKGSINKACEYVRINQKVYRKWMEDPDFRAYLEIEKRKVWDGLEPVVLSSLRRNIQKGDNKAIQMWLETQKKLARALTNVHVGPSFDFSKMTAKEIHAERERVLEAIDEVRRERAETERN